MGSNLSLEVMSDFNMNDSAFYKGDAGIDIPCPSTIICKARQITSINLGVRCQLVETNIWGYRQYLSYYLVPRSSISKTPLIMSNSIGIIDSGYTGDLIVNLYNYSDSDYTITENDRLVQIITPNMVRPNVVFVESLRSTDRMGNGFGST
jgi:dUTP pyrophosphatase